MNQLTEIAVVIDKSGSMYNIQQDTIGGFNAFIDEQRKLEGQAYVTLALFNSRYQLVYDGEDINEIPHLTEDTYKPSGNTALYDAIGRTIDGIDQRLKGLPPDKKPDTVIFAILTDGFENSSTDFNQGAIFRMISEKRQRYDWEFVFLAANQDAMKSGASISIPKNNTYNFQATAVGAKKVYDDLTTHTSTIRISRMWKGNDIPDDGTTDNRRNIDDGETMGFHRP